MKSVVIARGFDVQAAAAHLGKRDRKLARWMRRIGPIERDFEQRFDPVDALAHSILYQQLSGKAAATIAGRVEALMPRGRRITARGLDSVDDASLRAAGVSRNKVAALRDLAAKSHEGIVPTPARLARMPDQDLIDHLIQVRGIGRWTVEMLLMFRLGRPDVLPIHDLGIRKGAQIVHGFDELPAPLALQEFGALWGPYRTLASFYLWKIVEAANPPKPGAKPTRRSQD
ncbi:MAG TPA: DNA-3-methyladenine glycosylase 2 family protein [Rhodanobacteraceae bacterium]|jgi:DNA-3-methyladenine glycosylase II|nr:DNA-3-methyladenine glycosylase 2 family protein [Rhodanobacteraceae bacterium]